MDACVYNIDHTLYNIHTHCMNVYVYNIYTIT